MKHPKKATLLILSSVTYAMQAQQLLAERHIYTDQMRSISGGKNGCGYGLRLHDPSEETAASDVLASAGIEIKEIRYV